MSSLLFHVLSMAAIAGMAEAALRLTPATGKVVANEYVVQFRSDATSDARAAHMARLTNSFSPSSTNATTNAEGLSGFTEAVLFEYNMPAFKGYSARLSSRSLNRLLAAEDATVSLVEPNQVVKASQGPEPMCMEQDEATWGLVRVNEKKLDINGVYTYLKGTGEDVDAYILDTGIYTQHVEFEGRAVWGFDATKEGEFDGNGHGTHVAGTVMSKSFGVAKDATAVAVKVLASDGSGSNAGVIAGVDFTCSEHRAKLAAARKSKKKAKSSVANMSLGGSTSTALNNAVNAAVACGVPYAVAAGNENNSACDSSPASAKAPVTVGASDNQDYRSSFSNYGFCVNLFAPGSSITSTWIGGPTAINTISGTSMASPHVCGVMAKILSFSPSADPADVTSYLLKTATQGALTDIKFGSPNKLLYSNCEA